MQDIATTQDGGVSNLAIGSLTSDNSAVAITTGFKPRYVKVINLTDKIVWEWTADMAATHTLKTVAAGTITDDTTSAIVPHGGPDGDFRGFTLSAAAADNAKVIHYIAFG